MSRWRKKLNTSSRQTGGCYVDSPRCHFNRKLKDMLQHPLLFLTAAWLSCLMLSLPGAADAEGVELTLARHLRTVTGDFRQPSDVAVNSWGEIYVVDGVNNAIKVFSAKGRSLFTIGRRGQANGEFLHPLGIDIDDRGRIYVADSGNGRIQIFSRNGKFISSVALRQGREKPADPTDIAVTRSGAVGFIADNDNHCILKYDLTTGRLLETFGQPGIERKEFRYPFLMSLYKDKYLHVVDVVNTRVQILTDTGKFVSFVGDWGVEKGQFFRPKGVAVDTNGLIYVSDSYMGVIQVFTGEGHFHSVIGDPETGRVKHFSTPVGIFIDSNNNLYVVEMFADKITVFALEHS